MATGRRDSVRTGWICLLALLVGGLLFEGGMIHAASPRIPGFERFHRDSNPMTSQAGRLLVGELNCLSCHKIDPDRPDRMLIQPKRAPRLEQVGSRVNPAFLRSFLDNPQSVKPGSTMPRMLGELPAAERKERIEDLVHFLASTGQVVPTPPAPASVKRGEALFHSIGCIACHNSMRSDAESLNTSVPLGNPASKYSIGSLAAFLKDPHAVRPSGRMPGLNLSDDEARDVSHYLLRDIKVDPNVNYAVFHGNWNSLPDFSTLKPVAEGGAAGFDLTVAGRTNQFAIQFRGFVHIRQSGRHRFFLGSDDGSRLMIDDREIVNVDGIHPYTEKSAEVDLKQGVYPLVVDFFQGGGEWIIKVDHQPPGGKRQQLAGLVTPTREPRRDSKDGFVLDKSRAERGRQQFLRIGCNNCHQWTEDDRLVDGALDAPAWDRLEETGGCLTAPGTAGVPDYSLDGQQVAAIRRMLASDVIKEASAAEIIDHSMTTLNCYACHARDGRGGVERGRDTWFTGRIPEMGDEGRIPPLLDGVGDKLKLDWLKHVMDQGARDRPYMDARMPRFGRANAEQIVERFAQLDVKDETPAVEFVEADHRILASARFMVGDQALSCIKCHNFAGRKGTGIQSVDLTTMATRLRRDWFIRYMVNPQVYRPGTRMPSAWPNGDSILPKVLGGDTGQQLAAIWRYLEDGNKARIPTGLGGQQIELIPKDEPIVYRNFIDGLSPRAIAVGHPEKAHFAFDARTMAPVWIWHRGFIDAGKHWVGRGPGNQTPLGDHLFSLGNHVPLAELETLDAAWPSTSPAEQGFQFLGYRLDDRLRPVFRYRWRKLAVEDAFVPVPRESDAAFLRTIRINGPRSSSKTWFRVASGTSLTLVEDGVYLLDKGVQLSVNGARPELHVAGDRVDLLVPVPPGNGKFEFSTLIDW